MPPRGMVLVVVLIVVAFLALAGFAYCELMLAEHNGVQIQGRQMQAHMLAESGIEYVKKFLTQDLDTQISAGGRYDNAERFQGVVVIDDEDPRECGRFAVVSPNMEEGREGAVRFGLEDESGRLNLNTLLYVDKQSPGAGRTLLMKLPNMTEDVADAILDWIDPDDEPRENGAELDYYSSLDPPYKPKNGPLDTVEELLLVRGVTPQLLFGSDANRNGMLDTGEQAADQSSGDQTDQSSNRGWSAYLTLHSYETNLKADGTARINLNATDLKQLYQDLSQTFDESWATYIIAYRQFGPYVPPNATRRTTGPNQQDEVSVDVPVRGAIDSIPVTDLDLSQPGRFKFSSVLDLIGGYVQYTPHRAASTDTDNRPVRPKAMLVRYQVPPDRRVARLQAPGGGAGGGGGTGSGAGGGGSGGGGGTGGSGGGGSRGSSDDGGGGQGGRNNQKIARSPFSSQASGMTTYLPKLMDNLTTNKAKKIPGRVNINQAPKTVLLGIPGMTEDMVDQIIARRQVESTGSDSDQKYETWPLSYGIVTLPQMKKLMPFVNAGGNVFRAQIVGYFEEKGPAARLEVIVDATTSTPRMVFWRDISHLGRGYPVETLGISAP